MKRTIWIVLALVVLATPLFSGLFHDHLIKGDDAVAGLLRVLCMQKYMGDGQIYPRWLADVNFGYGSPMFNFYPPFFSLVTIIFSKIIPNMLWALNFTCIFFWLLSGVAMYFLAREFWGNKGGFLSALVYMYAPYHIQDLYERGALAEFTSFAFFPMLVLSFYKLNQQVKKRYIFLGILATFCLSLNHNVMSMLFFPIIALYVLLLFVYKRNFKALFVSVGALALGLMMTAFFWLPALIEKKYLTLYFLFNMRYDFHKNFISLNELFHLPWTTFTHKGLYFEIGFISIILVLVGGIYLVMNFKKNILQFWHYLFFLLIAFFAIYLTLPSSTIVWERISPLKFLQFPWRILAIIVFALSFLSGSVMRFFKNNWVSYAFLIIFIFLIIFSSVRYLTVVRHIDIDHDFIVNNFTKSAFMGEGEYTPGWILIPPRNDPKSKFEFFQGEAQVLNYEKHTSLDHTARVRVVSNSILCFHTFYFPGWKAWVDGKEVKIFAENPLGAILIKLLPGEHEVRVKFGSTAVRDTGAWISIVGLLLLILGMVFYKRWEPWFFK